MTQDVRAATRNGASTSPRANTALWVLQGLTAAFFAFASATPKLIGHSSAREIFDDIGYGDWFMYLIGPLELAGAIALVIPLLAGLSALAFMGLMTGAFIYSVTVFDGENAATPLILLVVFAVIAWGRHRSVPELINRLTKQGQVG
jgi:hypothetical protein